MHAIVAVLDPPVLDAAILGPIPATPVLAWLPLSWPQLLVVGLAILAAYIIFGIAGFGTALVAGPVLAHLMPLSTIVPLLALLDFSAAGLNIARGHRAADRKELGRLVPMMALGSLVGAAILLRSQPRTLLLALAVFAIGQSLYTLSGMRPLNRFPSQAAVPFGFIGGLFSALFGSGGFLYAIYLGGRLDTADRIRVTQSTLIGLSTLMRVLLFMLAGVYADPGLWALAAILAPVMLLGTSVGQRIALSLTRVQFLRIVNLAVLVSGLALVGRYLGS